MIIILWFRAKEENYMLVLVNIYEREFPMMGNHKKIIGGVDDHSLNAI